MRSLQERVFRLLKAGHMLKLLTMACLESVKIEWAMGVNLKDIR